MIRPTPRSTLFPYTTLFRSLPVTSRQRLIGLRKGIGRNNQLNAALFAQAQQCFATGMLLLKQGEFKHEVGFNVDVHTTTSYARRPSLTAVRKPDSTSHFCPLATCSGTSPALTRSLNQAPTTNSKA